MHSAIELKKAQRLTSTPKTTVRLAVMAALAAAGSAQAQEAPTGSGDQAIQEVVVTGSRIRRVDTETASPVLTLDSALISQSGAQTVSELAMMLPDVNGSAINGSTNNGGGFGEENIELRGLDSKRTVILIDGRRFGAPGDSNAVDVGQIPLSIIDHVEVLKEGAGAIYGSDAIAGVVNFITRKDVQGVEISADYGRSTAADAGNRQFALTFGDHSDKFDFLLSGRYEVKDQLLEGRRSFSKFAIYASSSSIFKGGSSRTPTGSIFLPTSSPLADNYGCTPSSGTLKLTKITGTDGSLPSDYRCFVGGGPNDDHYNYAPLNYLVTPQERGTIFSNATYRMNDSVTAYGSIQYNRTHSGFQEAELPFDSQLDNIVISQYSMYNPFGVSFGGNSGAFTDAEWRLSGLGPRHSDTTTETVDVTAGVKGNILSTGWTFDLFGSYARLDQNQRVTGYFFSSALAQMTGPSMLVNGVPTCVATPNDPSTAIAGCTPLNIFAVNDPTASTAAERAAFATASTDYNTNRTSNQRDISLDVQGAVFRAPGGDSLLDVGIEHMEKEGQYLADQIVIAQPPLYLSCEISQETCTGNTNGHYSNTDLFGELFVPLLKDLPLVKALNVDVGVRWSDYTLTGSTTKATFKLEYKPIPDLLIRSTFAQIYRVGTIKDLFGAPEITSAVFIDPCNRLTAAAIAATPGLARACVGVPTDGSFAEANGQVTGLITSNPDLKPESGHVITAGLIYEPSFVPSLSFDADYWSYTINNVITEVDPNYAINQCIENGGFCDLAVRYAANTATPGQMIEFLQPTLNLGTLKTDGVDLGLKYSLNTSDFGTFKFALDVTHVMNYDTVVSGSTAQFAGTYSNQYGNDSKWRGLMRVQWAFKGVEVLASEQFIDKIVVPGGFANSPGLADTNIYVPSIWYTNLSLGYTYAPTNTHIQAGVDNALNRQAPLLYQNNVQNANTDVSTYDTVGRRWFVSFTQKF
jgi:iron complex outermembrane recepter protein